jgi:hypothetical protein
MGHWFPEVALQEATTRHSRNRNGGLAKRRDGAKLSWLERTKQSLATESSRNSTNFERSSTEAKNRTFEFLIFVSSVSFCV